MNDLCKYVHVVAVFLVVATRVVSVIDAALCGGLQGDSSAT